MARTVAIGSQDFCYLRENNYFYLDKTAFIREWWDAGDSVTLITRPRRFGKTLTMSMLEYFFSHKYAARHDLFEGLEIWKDERYRALQGTYPVIFLSFAGVKQTSFEAAKSMINSVIANLFPQYEWLLSEGCLTQKDREFYQQISRDMDVTTAALSLNMLCGWLKRYYGKSCIILLDEYDTPLQEAYLNGYWDELSAYLRVFLNNTFKTNPALARGLLTGITRVSKESIFSDLNNINVITTTSEDYAASFGFTEAEVFAAMDEQGIPEKEKAQVKYWYDGFTFGSVKDIYNPWSIICYLDKKKYDTYWANTSGNALVSRLIMEGDKELKASFESLLYGGVIETKSCTASFPKVAVRSGVCCLPLATLRSYRSIPAGQGESQCTGLDSPISRSRACLSPCSRAGLTRQTTSTNLSPPCSTATCAT